MNGVLIIGTQMLEGRSTDWPGAIVASGDVSASERRDSTTTSPVPRPGIGAGSYTVTTLSAV